MSMIRLNPYGGGCFSSFANNYGVEGTNQNAVYQNVPTLNPHSQAQARIEDYSSRFYSKYRPGSKPR